MSDSRRGEGEGGGGHVGVVQIDTQLSGLGGLGGVVGVRPQFRYEVLHFLHVRLHTAGRPFTASPSRHQPPG